MYKVRFNKHYAPGTPLHGCSTVVEKTFPSQRAAEHYKETMSRFTEDKPLAVSASGAFYVKDAEVSEVAA